mgnify:CR=1 FL=1
MVGFEFHIQILTKHKMFSSKFFLVILRILASLCTFSEDPNTQVAYLDMGLPGMLPCLNENCLN